MAERKPLPGWVVWSRRLLIGCGTVALAYAVSGAIASPDMRLTYLRFLGAVLVGHDLILLPVAIAVGVHQGNADG
ncbi:MAG TPA: hypothetical protein DGT23_06800, partial [Micromonosporaceae bacterium]|nr:hypothetical protein [Micromonosporaceae bacterium]